MLSQNHVLLPLWSLTDLLKTEHFSSPIESYIKTSNLSEAFVNSFIIKRKITKWPEKITKRNTSGRVFTHKHTQRLFNLIIHTHICGAVHTLCLDHVHLNLSRLYTTVHSVVHILQAALIFLNLNKFKWVAAFLLRLVHTLCSDQLFGSGQVLLKMANVSIVSVDPHQRLVDQPNLQLHYFSLKPGSVHFSCIIFLWNQVLYICAVCCYLIGQYNPHEAGRPITGELEVSATSDGEQHALKRPDL